ncbi:MAG: DinB family protein [Chloroflexota bacterium]
MSDAELRNQLTRLLTERQAHMDFEDAVAAFPAAHVNARPPAGEYTFWHLVEHLRICQKDILDYIVADDYRWPNFPDDLWPARTATTDLAGWQRSVEQFLADRRQLVAIVSDPAVDLFAPLPNSGEHRHHVLREINIIASHNAYHTGELAGLRGVMGLWSQERGQP